jgi:hypothetical protein
MSKSRKEKPISERPPPSETLNPRIGSLQQPQKNMIQNILKSLKELLAKINSKTISVNPITVYI